MMVKTQNGTEELCQGETLIVNLSHMNGGGPHGYVDGRKVIIAQGIKEVHTGERWEVEEVLRWSGGSDRPESPFRKSYQSWTGCVYAWPVRRLT